MRARGLTGSLPLPIFGFIALCAIWLVLVVWTNLAVAALQAGSTLPNLPYGVFATGSSHAIATQDLAYNKLFLRGISEHVVAHPYRMEEQEKMMRHLLPECANGMPHAYSPVALVLALPFLPLPGWEFYLVYTLVSAASVLALYYFFLMPRITETLQVGAFLACACSLCVVAQLKTGQSALLTTTLIAAIWFLLRDRFQRGGLGRDVVIAVLFWMLCAKTNVALVPGLLLLAERAWRPLALGAALLLTTWLATANYYGGLVTGLQDYVHLLNHYNYGEFSPYMSHVHDTEAHRRLTVELFAFDRAAIPCLSAALLFLRWSGRIGRSQLFQGTLWIFVLLSPYLISTEHWILVLLIVEPSFLQSVNRLALAVKFLLLVLMLNLREGITASFAAEVDVKWLLFGWVVIDALWRWWVEPETPTHQAPLHDGKRQEPELSQPGRWA